MSFVVILDMAHICPQDAIFVTRVMSFVTFIEIFGDFCCIQSTAII
jgi:hypothetical protein